MKKFFAMIAMVLPLVAMAQSQKDNITLPASTTTFQMAAELSRYGYANNDALSLLQAARIAIREGYSVDQKTKKEGTEGGQATEPGAKKETTMTLDATKLLDDAAAMAGKDNALLAMIADARRQIKRGGPNGYVVSSVAAGGTDRYTAVFRGGENAIVMVIGDGDTDLDLYIYDENGNLITYDNDYTDNCVCTFTPRWTGTFVIKIVNRGRVYNNYVLRTN